MLRSFSLSVVATFVCGWLWFGDGTQLRAAEGPVPDENFFVRSWQTDEGLPDNSVNDVVQDGNGFLWLGTIGGLVRFDGVTFKVFDSPQIDRASIRNIRALVATPDASLLMLPAVGGVVELKDGKFVPQPIGLDVGWRQFQTLFVERGGAVWLGMSGGHVRRWENGTNSDFGPANGLSNHARITLAEERDGRVWLASDGYLGYFGEGKLHRFPDNQAQRSYAVAASRSGGIWICDSGELLKMDGGQAVSLSADLPWASVRDTVREMFEDRTHALWIGTSAHGLFRFAGGKFEQVETSQSQITCITDDSEGDIWVGTAGGGLNRLRPRRFELYNTKSGLSEDFSDALCADGEGDVWLANRGGGVVRIRDGQATVLNDEPGVRKRRAYAICTDNQGWVWVNQGGLYRFPRDHPELADSVTNYPNVNFSGIHVLFKSRNGDLWVGGDPNVLGRFRGGRPEDFVLETKFPGQLPRSIAEDAAGRIWVGTENGQLVQLADGKFTLFAQKDGLPEAPVRSLCADAGGAVWIGTVGGGLAMWREGKITSLTSADGLPDDNIAEMIEDNAGRLWCGTRSGIFHVAIADLRAFADGKIARVAGTPFGKSQGLAEISCLGTSQPMTARTPDGRLWFATQQGVLSLDASALKANSRPPPVFIDALFVNDRQLDLTDSLKVPALCHKIEFRFSVLNYAAPQSVRIRYKLDGVDSDWVEIVDERAAVYSGLRPGNYRMHLKACNNDGVWNETGTSLAFVVEPAWWQSWWFQGSLVIVFLTCSAMGVRYLSQRRLKSKLERLEHQQSLAKERTRIARDLHDDLGATVTQVGLMLEEMRATPFSVEAVKSQSAAISGRVLNLARDLDAVVWSVNPGNDSLNELFAYLGQSFLECFRRTAIRPRLEVMETVPDFALAPEVRHHLFLLVKEAMNNVIKHSQATEVTLSLKVVENILEIRIADNGCGFSLKAVAQSKRHGIANMRARVEQLGGQLEATSAPGQGTVLRFLIPSWKDLRVEPHRHN
jgi:signal transduction histidine kinase/sugar lactone lactonase YvrE